MDEAVSDFSKHPKLKDTDSVVVVIMSHGELGKILGINHSKEAPDVFSIDDIYSHLGSEKCPALIHKPKIIIIQACRGGDCHRFLQPSALRPPFSCSRIGEQRCCALKICRVFFRRTRISNRQRRTDRAIHVDRRLG